MGRETAVEGDLVMTCITSHWPVNGACSVATECGRRRPAAFDAKRPCERFPTKSELTANALAINAANLAALLTRSSSRTTTVTRTVTRMVTRTVTRTAILTTKSTGASIDARSVAGTVIVVNKPA